jgi:hypothetical protein
MKKTILGILATAAVAASSFGQSSMVFATYNGGEFIGTPITYGGSAVGANFSAELSYFSGGVWTDLPSTITPYFGVQGDLSSGAGYFFYGGVTLPVAPGTVTLMVKAFNNVTVDGNAPGTITGSSASFTMTTVDPGLPTYPSMSSSTYQGFVVTAVPVPEPTTFALAGLGSAALLIFRRRKA